MFQEEATYECVGNLARDNLYHQNIIKISLKAFEPMNKSILAKGIKCPEKGWLNCIEGLFQPTDTGLQSFSHYTSDGGLKFTRQAHLHRETGFIYMADTFYTGAMNIAYTKYCSLEGKRQKGIAVDKYWECKPLNKTATDAPGTSTKMPTVFSGSFNQNTKTIDLVLGYKGGGLTVHKMVIVLDSCNQNTPAQCKAHVNDQTVDADEGFQQGPESFSLERANLNSKKYSRATLEIKGAGDSKVTIQLPEIARD